MHIVFQVHHADADDALREKAARGVEKLTGRLRRPIDATVRVAHDGALRRVEITVRASRRPALVAVGSDRQTDAALAAALEALEAQIARERDARARRQRRLVASPLPGQPVEGAAEEPFEA